MNQMRGFLLERGMTVRKGPSHLMAQLQEVLCEGGAFFSARLRGLLHELKQEWDELDRRIKQANDALQRLALKLPTTLYGLNPIHSPSWGRPDLVVERG